MRIITSVVWWLIAFLVKSVLVILVLMVALVVGIGWLMRLVA